ncbi:hypothetical protein OIO90_001357 [Microbotryomycetes sp. JL221]|nr:hypothetical protein OIO90_001357 [Microbotryomycetes sp. JL221]
MSLNDPKPQEFAFGGHDNPRITGIFAIPAGTAPSRMPGLRYYTEIKLGKAFGSAWRKEFTKGSTLRICTTNAPSSNHDLEVRSIGSKLGSGPSLLSLLRGTTDDASTVNQDIQDDVDNADSDGGVSEGITYMSRDQRRAWRLIEQMKKSDEWRGTRYQLLTRNCNTFTQELVYKLTGTRAPAWINRAAWVATSIPCIVPNGWLDDVEETAPDAPSGGSLVSDTHRQNGASVLSAPSTTEPMSVRNHGA